MNICKIAIPYPKIKLYFHKVKRIAPRTQTSWNLFISVVKAWEMKERVFKRGKRGTLSHPKDSRSSEGQSGIELVVDRIDGASMGFGALAEVGDDLGILGSDIELLGRVVIELIEEWGIVLDDRVGSVLGLGQKMGLERAMANSEEP